MDKILVIIPSWNEARGIANVIMEIKQFLPQSEILVIDDGSTDNTYSVALNAGAKVVSLPLNLGIGGAMQTGFLYAKCRDFKVAIQVDGDGQHDPSQIPLLLKQLETSDLVIGSRYIDKDGFISSRARRMGTNIFKFMLKFLTGKVFTDPTSGFRAINSKVINEFANNYPTDFPEVEVITQLNRRGFKINEVPVKMRERKYGHSSITLIKSIWYMIKVGTVLLIGESKGRVKQI
ncbi:glycosyltransferase family 2 protein [Desulfosporosinus acididurans]|uniref:glycosyltransferase family 2 protein n=1 Tax=Desulfosporosinus acididurans TaxID=476652 RepID=UPI001FA7443A|nr:glycosyltransferase family 2 protein [Desulfosporosinus acididurans]